MNWWLNSLVHISKWYNKTISTFCHIVFLFFLFLFSLVIYSNLKLSCFKKGVRYCMWDIQDGENWLQIITSIFNLNCSRTKLYQVVQLMIKGFQIHFKDVALLVDLYPLCLKILDLYSAKPQVSYPTERQYGSREDLTSFTNWQWVI